MEPLFCGVDLPAKESSPDSGSYFVLIDLAARDRTVRVLWFVSVFPLGGGVFTRETFPPNLLAVVP